MVACTILRSLSKVEDVWVVEDEHDSLITALAGGGGGKLREFGYGGLDAAFEVGGRGGTVELVEECISGLQGFVLRQVETLLFPICVRKDSSAAALFSSLPLAHVADHSLLFSPTETKTLVPHPTRQHNRSLLLPHTPATFQRSYSVSSRVRRPIRSQKRPNEPRSAPSRAGGGGLFRCWVCASTKFHTRKYAWSRGRARRMRVKFKRWGREEGGCDVWRESFGADGMAFLIKAERRLHS
ncbi:hypothetical protein KC332_g81 [Hortaea werneckii]|nr:hypothetical protein KC332_g81 [Hortaea werneckii]